MTALVGVTIGKMKVTGVGLIFTTLYVCAFSQSYTFPANEYEFSIRRDALKQAERIFEGKSNDLTEVCNSVVTQLSLMKIRSTTQATFRIRILSNLILTLFKIFFYGIYVYM